VDVHVVKEHLKEALQGLYRVLYHVVDDIVKLIAHGVEIAFQYGVDYAEAYCNCDKHYYQYKKEQLVDKLEVAHQYIVRISDRHDYLLL
jgi:hypothetical protein